MKPWKTYTYETPQQECLTCRLTKDMEEFQYMKLMPKHRHFNCKECEAMITFTTGVNLSAAAQHSKISKKQMYQYPELIEANRLIKAINRTVRANENIRN